MCRRFSMSRKQNRTGKPSRFLSGDWNTGARFFFRRRPGSRVNHMRRAFDATMKDPAFLADAEKAKVDVDAMTGEQVAKLVDEAMMTPKDVVARIRDALASGGK